MAKINFYLREKSKEGETPIMLFVSFNGTRLKYPTGKTIHPKFWNEETQQARHVKEFPKAKVFNGNLKFIRDVADRDLETLSNQLGRVPTPHELKQQLDLDLKSIPADTSTTDGPPTFLGLFERFIRESETGFRTTDQGKRIDKRTVQKYRTTFERLKKFGRKYNLTFDTINKDFYEKYKQSLNKEGYRINTVGKHIQVVKTFMAYATENGYNANMYFKSKSFRSFNVTGFSIYLDDREINDLYRLDLSGTPHLERVRDLFIVGCWTGLRFSDLTNIKPENIEGEFLHVKTFKTGEKVIIPIHPMVRAIMAKYDNSLPKAISNQKFNQALKEVCRQAESLHKEVITEHVKGGLKVEENRQKWELTTTHTARRSFATNLYKSGFPAISITKVTGHRTETAFLKYIKVTPEDTAQKLMEHWNKSVLKVG